MVTNKIRHLVDFEAPSDHIENKIESKMIDNYLDLIES